MAKSDSSATDEILKILKSIQEKQTKMEHRLDALEEHVGNILLPTRRRISPALQDTLIAVQKLAGPDRWVSIPQISEETKRSIQTEEGYARKLEQLGIIRRQPFIASRKDKKRREYRYRPKE